ncbi:hypothetical protein TKK_0011413 [Trichogramma kaykai]
MAACATAQQESIEEDHRLANWKRWLRDRERRQKYLSAALKREPYELALNAYERARDKNETACGDLGAKTVDRVDRVKYSKDDLDFWRPPERLHKYSEAKGDDVTLTEPQRLRKLVAPKARISRIRRSNNLSVALENDATSRKTTTCGNAAAASGDGLQMGEPPSNLSCRSLAVIGKAFTPPDYDKKVLRLPVITVTEPERKRPLLQDPDSRAVLLIRDRELVAEGGRFFERLSRVRTEKLKRSKKDQHAKKYAYSVYDSHVYKIFGKEPPPIVWTVHFHSKGDEICKKFLRIENKGVKIMTFDWLSSSPDCFPDMPYRRIDSCFFFDKTSFKIYPGQVLDFRVLFHSKKSRVASELWTLQIQPQIYPSPIQVRLWGMSEGLDEIKRENDKIEEVTEKLELLVRDSITRELANALIDMATSCPLIDETPYDLFFLERDIFRSLNRRHHYKSVQINELKFMWQETIDDEATSEWNLDLADLRAALLKIEDPLLQRDMLKRFGALCDELLLPDDTYTQPRGSSRQMVYWLLGEFFNEFETTSHSVWHGCRLLPPRDDHCEEEEEDEGEGEEEAATACGESDEEKAAHLRLYHETMHMRIYALLCRTINQVCHALESDNLYNKND